MSVLDVELTVDIGDIRVIDDVEFRLRPGERVALIGESGSGKTLTALALLGLLPDGVRARGTVTIAGEQIIGRTERDIARLRGDRIAMVFQEPMTALNPVMKVGAQLVSALKVHGRLSRSDVRRRARELLEQVEMGASYSAYPHQLSGGQRQRVVLAMAIAHDPQILVCDEPTTALDVTVARRVLALVDRLVAERNMALLFISHDLALVSGLCERVLVMYGGRIVEAGPVDTIFSDPRHPYTAGLLAASDLTDAPPGSRLTAVPGTVPDPGQFPAGCVFRGRCDREIPDCVNVPPLSERDGRLVACVNPVPSND